jgi:adenosylcobyric acid synthase
VFGIYAHGLFENPQVVQALFGVMPPNLAAVFARMAAVVERTFGRDVLLSLIDSQ